MLAKRIIPCLDVRDGKVTKGVQFLENADVGDPVAMARHYYQQGADEIVFYDITASNERRGIMLDVVRAVAREIFIPFSVGGGLRTLDDMRAVLLAGAEKVSIDSGAVRNPVIISEGARAFGSQCIVLSMQVKQTGKRPGVASGYEVVIDGGRQFTGKDAIEWAREGERLGAGELCVNSIDRDGTNLGYELELTRAVSEAVTIPVIASGGAGEPEHLRQAFTIGAADAAIVASIVHYGTHPIPALKSYLRTHGVEVREQVTIDTIDKRSIDKRNIDRGAP
ncbi:MAG: imidazole glycerol phosphate synthase subunit HisF [Candidatus Binatales bacterium]